MERHPWQTLDFKHLAALSAIAREGTFRAAAESLGYVQSAVSEQIAGLEASIGTSVLERRRGAAPAALTPAGEVLLTHFEQVLNSLGAASAALEALDDGRRGRLRIGASESVTARLLPAILRRLVGELPELDVELLACGSADDLLRTVEAGQLDAVFVHSPSQARSLESHPLLSDPFVLLARADSPAGLAGRPPTPDELQDLDLIHAGDDKTAELVDASLRAHGIEPRYRVRVRGEVCVQALVAAGVAAAIVPRVAVDGHDDRVVAIRLDNILRARPVSLIWHPQAAGPTLERFTQIAKSCCLDSRSGPVVRRLEPAADATHTSRAGTDGLARRAA